MHELSLALEVCRLARETLAASPGAEGRVLRVGVEVGEDSGVEAEGFRFCLDALLSEAPFTGASTALIPRPGTDLRLAWLEVDDGSPND